MSSSVRRHIDRMPFFFSRLPPPPRSPLFPYTTLFRSLGLARDRGPGGGVFLRGRGAARAWLTLVPQGLDRKSTRLNSSHRTISYAVFCLKKKNLNTTLGISHLLNTPSSAQRHPSTTRS